jgi:hypothetical protein
MSKEDMSDIVERIVRSRPVADVPQVDLAKSMVNYKSREQKQLEVLERIEALLIGFAEYLMQSTEPLPHQKKRQR